MMKKLAVLLVCFLAASTAFAQDMNVTKSPDGSKEAFTRDNDLWVRSLPDSTETRLTFDGSELSLNGYASWVYYEEILGRGSRYKAFWWSPDSKKIGFYHFDNSNVSMFPIFSPFGQNGSLSRTRYPKAGQDNPKVKIGVIDLEKGPRNVVWADFNENDDQYFGTPFWGADSREIYISHMPRRQSQLDLYAVSAENGSKRHVYHEEYPTWIDWISGMVFTEKGLYMARDFDTGWYQIYFLGYDGELKCLTTGDNWNVNILKVDEKKGDIWYTALRDSRLHTGLYRVDKKGRTTALTDPEFSISGVRVSEDGKTFTASMANGRTASKRVKGSMYKYDLKENTDPEPARPGMGMMPASAAGMQRAKAVPSEIVKIENDGFDLYGSITYPKDFDPARKYPVVMYVYGGPGTANVSDAGMRKTENDWFYQNGIIYMAVDPRSSGENGRRGMDQAFRRMTVIELQDYVAWAKWLQSQPWVDGKKIGVHGFSFGGTTTTMLVLRFPQYFSCGVAGGGVYNWDLYDSHYTERFMDTPQANPDGYAEASALTWIPKIFADDYTGVKPEPFALKITHGTGDDNVHFQNTLQLIDALQKVNYQFELMIYPDGMHGYRGAQSVHDVTNDHAFWTKHLLQ